MAAEKKRLAHWFSGKPRAKPLEGRRQRAVSRGQEAPQRAGMGILAAGPLVLANAGTPFAAPNAQSMRLQSRERSRPQACGSERSRRPAPSQSHANRIQRRARSGPRRGLTPPSRPTAAPYLRHTEAGDGGVCPRRRKRRLGLKGPSRARPPAPSQPSTDSPTHTAFEASPKPDVPLRLRRSSACSRRSDPVAPAAQQPRTSTAHSGRDSAEFRRPVRGSERAINAPSAPRERAVPAQIKTRRPETPNGV
jgi:hypothetical protein